MNITKSSLVIEADGKTCACDLKGVGLDLLVNLAASIHHKNKLLAIPLGKNYKWESLNKGVKNAT